MLLPSFAKADKKEKSFKNSEKSHEMANENAKFKRGDDWKKNKKKDDDDDDKDDDDKDDDEEKKDKKMKKK